jgi:hypothetical protein
MEFPISRHRLQNYRVNEAISVETKQRVLKEIEQICRDLENTVLRTNDRKYVYRISYEVKGGFLRPNNVMNLAQSGGIIKELLVALKKIFPDSNIILDPLETYIVIDWS